VNPLEHRLGQTLLFGVLPLSAGMWILTWMPHQDVLHPWLAAAAGTLILGGELVSVGVLARLSLPETLQAAWRLLLLSLTAGGGLFAALLSRYLGAPVLWGQVLLAVALAGVIHRGLIWRPPSSFSREAH